MEHLPREDKISLLLGLVYSAQAEVTPAFDQHGYDAGIAAQQALVRAQRRFNLAVLEESIHTITNRDPNYPYIKPYK
jgi:hypothetical protein